jgi:hypothetical protein
MHNKALLVLTTLIVSFFYFSCKVSLGKKTRDIKITDVRTSKEPEMNLASHKDGDVEVYRSIFMEEEGYKVRYYQKDNGSLVSRAAFVMLKEDFDKAAFRWLTDTSVSIRLYNSVTNRDKKFEMYGRGSTSGFKKSGKDSYRALIFGKEN